jgi:hypothetical protein
MTLPHGARPTKPADVFLLLLGGMSVVLGFLLMVWAFNAEIVVLGVAALLVGVAFLWWGDKVLYTRHRDGKIEPSHGGIQGISTPDRWRRWLWVTPAILSISGIANLMNPHLDPGLRVEWMFVLLPLAVILFGYFLYAHYRERRRRRDASNGT